MFYALVVLPALFSSLERTAAGDIAALLFPPFYALCLACGGGVLAASLSLAIGAGGRWRVAAAAVVIMLACQGWAALALQPKMAELRSVWRHHPAPTRKSEEGRKPKASLETTARREFARLHVRSVALNGVAITLGLGLMGASGYFLGNKND